MKNKLRRKQAAARRLAFYRERESKLKKSKRFMQSYYATLKPEKEQRHE